MVMRRLVGGEEMDLMAVFGALMLLHDAEADDVQPGAPGSHELHRHSVAGSGAKYRCRACGTESTSVWVMMWGRSIPKCVLYLDQVVLQDVHVIVCLTVVVKLWKIV